MGEHCRKIYMVEISFNDGDWGATPNRFCSESEAEEEIERSRCKYPFISKFRIVRRKEKDEL